MLFESSRKQSYAAEDTSALYSSPQGRDTLHEVFSLIKLEALQFTTHALRKYKPNTRDTEYIEIFPPRTKLDLRIRKLKMVDIIRAYPTTMTQQVIEHSALDYIMTTNLIIYCNVYPEVYYYLLEAGSLTSFDRYMQVSAEVSRVGKTANHKLEFLLPLMELNALSGYRNPPVADFDPMKSLRALVIEQDFKHSYFDQDWSVAFRTAVRNLFSLCAPTKRYDTSFREYLSSYRWVTSGASDLGRVDILVDGEHKHFKARKNFLPYLYTIDELYDYVMQHLGVASATVILKHELGKVRIALTGDIQNYLIQSWLNDASTHCYTKLPGLSLELNNHEMEEVNDEMMTAMRNKYVIPFDYDKFDNNVTLDEVTTIMGEFIDTVSPVISPRIREEFQLLATATVSSVYHTLVRINVMSYNATVPVAKGLLSGVRWTSLIGNIFNLAVTTMVAKASQVKFAALQVRGDDTLLVVDTLEDSDRVLACYDSMGIKFNRMKFSVQYQRGEFLRNWYTPERMYGVIARVIPNIVQRKPWSSEPWTPTSTLESTYSALMTCSRRMSVLLRALISSACVAWSKIMHVSINYLHNSKQLGGLGLFPTTLYVQPSVKKPEIKGIEPKWKVRPDNMLLKPLDRYFPNTAPSDKQMHDLARKDFVSKIQSDSVAILIPSFISRLKTNMNKMFFQPLNRFSDLSVNVATRMLTLARYGFTRLMPLKPLYDKTYLEAVRLKAQLEGVSLMQVLTSDRPDIAAEIRGLERRLKCNRYDAISMMFDGSLSMFLNEHHPYVDSLLSKLVSYCMFNIRISFPNRLDFIKTCTLLYAQLSGYVSSVDWCSRFYVL